MGARGTDWGRLVLVLGGPASGRDLVLAERAAAALALGRLIEREHESLERQSHRTLLSALVDQSLTSHEILLRAKGLGVPLEGKALVGVVLRPVQGPPATLADQSRLRRLAEWTADSLKGIRALGLVGVLDDATIGLLLAVSDSARVDPTLDAISTRVRRSVGEADDDVVIAAGSTVGDVLEVRRSFLEAAQVADVAGQGVPRPFHRLADVGLTGLLHLLRRDERLQTFVERELGPLLAYDDANGTDLAGVLAPLPGGWTEQVAGRRSFGVSTTGVLRAAARRRRSARCRPGRRPHLPHPARRRRRARGRALPWVNSEEGPASAPLTATPRRRECWHSRLAPHATSGTLGRHRAPAQLSMFAMTCLMRV